MVPEMRRTVRKLFQKQWSPEQITKRLSFQGRESVSHETIYRFICVDALEGVNCAEIFGFQSEKTEISVSCKRS